MNAQNPTRLTLVVLAAGVGRRYGGLKQLEHVGPGGATIIDYTAFNAWRAGFERVVFIVRAETEPEFRALFERTIGSRMEIGFCLQEPGAAPTEPAASAGRKRHWGTGHAVLAAASEIHGPFAVANGDDLYSKPSLLIIREFLARSLTPGIPIYGLAGYELIDTLSDAGAVSRAVCHCDPNGKLLDIDEIAGIEKHARDGRYLDQDGVSCVLEGGSLVSMNLWAFHPTVFEQLRAQWERHWRHHGTVQDVEFGLPMAIRGLIQTGSAQVNVLRGDGKWCGLTHPRDKLNVARRIESLIESGEYPLDLWG